MTINFRGYVYNDAGEAVSGASVKLLETGTTTQEGSTVTTDSNGLWYFNEADQDRYDVEITKGTSVRRIKWNDEISLKEIDVRNNAAAGTPAATLTNLTNSASNQVAVFSGANTTRADNDEVYLSFKLANSAAELIEYGRMTAVATDVTDGTEDGQIEFDVMKAGTLTKVWTITSSASAAMSWDVNVDALTIGSGADTDVSLTFDANSADGVITWMEDEDYFQFSDDILMSTTERINLRDTAIYIYSSADGQLDLVADTEIQIAATTIDINGAVALNGAITGATNITLSGELDAATLDLSSSADIAGDLVLSGGADGALQFTNAGENSIKIPDNQASALIIEEANNAYITFVTTNSSEAITVAKATTFSAGIADSGTIAAGTWNGTAIATSYIAADAITGAKIADDAVDSEHYTDGSIDTAHIADNQVTLAKMAGLARGKIIYGDASGDPAALAVGNANYVLTSDGTDIAWAAASSGSTAADDIGTGDGAVNIVTSSGNITLDAQANDADVIIKVDDNGSAVTAVTFDGSDEGNAIFVNDVQLKSDGALLEFGADLDTTLTHTDGTGLTLNSTNKLTFGDAATFIHQSSDGVMTIDGEATIDLNASTAVLVSNDLKLNSDSAVLGFGGDNDTTLTHTDGTGLTLNSTNKLTFGDAASFIQQSADGTLRIDGEAIIDLNASTRVDISGTTTIGTSTQGFGSPILTVLQTNDTAAGIGRSDTGPIIRFFSGGVGEANQKGTIVTDGTDVTYETASDYRLKENQTAISDGLTRVKALKPYRYNFKSDPDTTRDGFFAHEVVEAGFPKAVTGAKDGTEYQGLDASRLIPAIVAAIKEIDARVTALE